ncbi:hypothetical protein GCM10007415_25130 [Parapedobacter pyrenivorans]|uniref:Histidine kinase n=1 Tax=Parapedobacter pyrenivorans TaxID=1305674 RepID=A0A917HTV6_9SPHI|nr:hypothetical protein [Parapedobacter pyrenivorans]GGG89825.1 hypothetical protein GCM10007415_25130 [Parapedobacter pyrenivorans]
MKNVGKNIRNTVAVHAVVWLAYSVAMVLHNTTKYNDTGVAKILVIMPLCMIVVYFTRWICWWISRAGNWHKAAVWLVLFYVVGLIAGYGYIEWLENRAGVAIHVDGAVYSHSRFVRNVLPFYLRYTSYGVGIFLFEKVLRLALTNKNMLKEAARLQSALMAATSQPKGGRIALHFLGNALQRCYRILQGVPNHAVEMVRRVDGLVNYALDEYAVQKPRLVRVEREMQRLREMMALDGVGEPGRPQVVLHAEENMKGLKVPPFTFISGYENILKHGVTDDEMEPATMRLHVSSSGYRFETCNRVAAKPTHQQTKGGYGLYAVRQRLELTLDGRFTLDHSEQDGQYRLELTVYI